MGLSPIHSKNASTEDMSNLKKDGVKSTVASCNSEKTLAISESFFPFREGDLLLVEFVRNLLIIIHVHLNVACLKTLSGLCYHSATSKKLVVLQVFF